jgi:hypothetical protein
MICNTDSVTRRVRLRALRVHLIETRDTRMLIVNDDELMLVTQ